MDAETTQELQSFKTKIEDELKARAKEDSGSVRQALKEQRAQERIEKEEEWKDTKRAIIKWAFGVAVVGAGGGGAYVRFAPDHVGNDDLATQVEKQDKINVIIHEKLGREVVKTREQMVESVQYLGEKIDAQSQGRDSSKVVKPAKLVEAEKDVQAAKVKAASQELLKLTPAEAAQVAAETAGLGDTPGT